ncbi:PEP-utilizing enzyme [Frankia sp. Cppng1_Ct_nod]|uniref:PEP-utilizing enzyme n=1 Tax=Frankia sp. Cppng1_Ct_nod TaxID=2897162 RepID=UPI0010416B7A|nr:PEP-utilizing enzyme [Frankia sp. Cppng1_Ct_nod]
MTGKQWIIDTQPSRRFPIYTRLNANDVLTDPITPLGASLGWIPHILPGWDTANAAYGSFTVAEQTVDVSPNAAFFYGHLYVNMTLPRLTGIRLGIGTDAVDMMWFAGGGEPPVHVSQADDVNEERSAAIAQRAAWVLSTTTFPELEEERAIADGLRAARPDLTALTPLALVARARSVLPLERLAWRGEVIASSGGAVGPGVLGQLLGGDPALVVRLIGKAGDVDSAAPSFALWELSRVIRGDVGLSVAFDGGVDSLFARLPAVHAGFHAGLSTFLRDFGYRGPNEWDLGSDTWETRPELPLALLDRLRHLDDAAAPTIRSADRVADDEAAVAEALDRLGGDATAEAMFHAALASARRFGAWRERAKTNCIKILHEARMPLVELGRRLHQQGYLAHPGQIFMATESELDTIALDPASLSATLTEREREWQGLFGLELPSFIDGTKPLPPLSSLGRRADTEVNPVKPGEVLYGVGAAAGVARGRARVVTAVDAAGDLEPGEILVAPQTDPSWTPLFMVAAASVVDVGAMGSHAMIVSRELGIPCAAGVSAASRRIPNGALLEVDGSAGTVTVLAL